MVVIFQTVTSLKNLIFCAPVAALKKLQTPLLLFDVVTEGLMDVDSMLKQICQLLQCW